MGGGKVIPSHQEYNRVTLWTTCTYMYIVHVNYGICNHTTNFHYDTHVNMHVHVTQSSVLVELIMNVLIPYAIDIISTIVGFADWLDLPET